ncbi:bifunctional diaminohydroxyphosphoribosylaminopyrimidine deaminase/5-amino-6-(5-phosphoribosylamino)uracil reductase RibD [Bhargavaea ullalensis]|uniref:Riboflavin biosynthesis protein RibD n=1 Tax=Bhargavaea ullalensis TaxID=1265685 RepID=A0ABV2GAA4_9BACL
MTTDRFMEMALDLAEGVAGQTSPNPPVGAVVVNGGRIVGTGAHLRAGGPHAEVHALAEAGEFARDADLYVTLEPCSHTGKTPPCTEAVIRAGIRRVFVGTRDPNPAVCSAGIDRLRQAGLEVELFDHPRAERIIRPFAHFIRTSTPYVTIKTAVTADGKTAAHTGHSRWITGPAAREDVHHLRSRHDAILTGIGTILQDNPLLTSRLPRGGKHPIRVILDTRLRTPVQSNILTNKEAPVWIICGSEAPSDREHALTQAGATVLRQATPDLRIADLLLQLGERQIQTLLVEAGGEVNASFLESGHFNQFILYIAPKLIGGIDAPTAFGGNGFPAMEQAIGLTFDQVEFAGKDLKITAIKEGTACSQGSSKKLATSARSI